MFAKKLTVLSAAAALALGTAGLISGCANSDIAQPMSNDTGMYNDNANTAGSTINSDDSNLNYGTNPRSGTGMPNQKTSPNNGGTGTGTDNTINNNNRSGTGTNTGNGTGTGTGTGGSTGSGANGAGGNGGTGNGTGTGTSSGAGSTGAGTGGGGAGGGK